jgi:hypothetical protein
MPKRDVVFFSRGRVFQLQEEGGEGHGELSEAARVEGSEDVGSIEAFVTYPREPLLLSGWMIGDEMIRGKAAALDVSYGQGKVFLFGFNAHNRAQARSTLRTFFNALLYR